MEMIEKFKKLTNEQRKQFITIRDGAKLDVFLSETGVELTREEKARILEYFQSGKLSLSDDELDNVAGGCSFSSSFRTKCPRCGSERISLDMDIDCNLYEECMVCGETWRRP